MPTRLRSGAKTAVRRTLRRAGYDLVPLAAGFVKVQRRVLSQVDIVVDVGANVGQYGERLRDIGYREDIISFEPSREAFAILKSKSQGDDKWEVRQAALGSAAGDAELNLSANSVSSSLLKVEDAHLRAAPASRVVQTELVRVSTLDYELSSCSGRMYLKLDVQGYELPVLQGAEEVLSRVSAVQTEVSFDALYYDQTHWIQLCEFLEGRGFVVRYIEPGYEDRNTDFMLQADLLFVRPDNTATADRGDDG